MNLKNWKEMKEVREGKKKINSGEQGRGSSISRRGHGNSQKRGTTRSKHRAEGEIMGCSNGLSGIFPDKIC